jgi:hypothetical protein
MPYFSFEMCIVSGGFRREGGWCTDVLDFHTAKKPFNEEEAIGAYKRLIGRLPLANQYLLLYVLDLLTVFAKKSDKNMMPAASAYFPPFFYDRAYSWLTNRSRGDFPTGSVESPRARDVA